jgi:hypothetical membrane protein
VIWLPSVRRIARSVWVADADDVQRTIVAARTFPAALAYGGLVRAVPWWGVFSSATAPVLLIGGWALADALQPQSFDPVRQSVSSLARSGATDRWVMTLAFVLVAACYIVTGLALRPAASAGRLILVGGGLAGVLVAANPEAVAGGFSFAHALWAGVGFTFLTAWPLAARRPELSAPWGLRPAVAASAVSVIAGLLAWFVVELVTGGGHLGLAERLLGVAQVCWPLLVVLSCRLPGQPAALASSHMNASS